MFIDSHAHLNFPEFSEDLQETLDRASYEGVDKIIAIGAGKDMDGNLEVLDLSEKYNFIFPTVGIHPHDVRNIDEAKFREVKNLARHPNVVAIGEIGLDFYRNLSPKNDQIKWVKRFIDLAGDLNIPVIIHNRQAQNEITEVLRKADGIKGVMHCFSGDGEFLKFILDIGFYISISGVITFKNASNLREVVRKAPLERILIETDCPYLSPSPYRGKRNEPAYVKFIANEIANLKMIDVEDVAKATSQNTIELFGI